MRAGRLLSILMLLQARGRMSAQALAAEVDVSVATVYRDVDELSAAGVPVYAERGRSGGFRLQDGWRTRLTGLTVPEAQALFLAGLPGPAAELGLGDVMAAAQLKLLAALPAAWQADAQRLRARFHLDPVGWFQAAPAPSAHVPAVAEAVWGEHRLFVRYDSWTHVAERVIEPLGFVLKAGVWYVVARSGGEPRTFRLSSIVELRVLDETFARPAEFDLAGYWEASLRTFAERLYRETAVVRVSPHGLRALRRMSAAVAEAVARTESAPDGDGWLRLTIPIESIDDAARGLLALGPEVEALEPEALRERLAAAARGLARLYA
jgi:predicted DNA-binding transcriptional regulator YafY